MSTLSTFRNQGFRPRLSSRHVLWLLRIVPLVSVACALLATLVVTSGSTHFFLIGLASGFIAAVGVLAFSVKRIELNETPQPSDLHDIRITR